MVGENTHLTRLGGQVDLDDILGLVDGLRCWVRQLALAVLLHHSDFASCSCPAALHVSPMLRIMVSYLMREGQAKLDLFLVAKVSKSSHGRQ